MDALGDRLHDRLPRLPGQSAHHLQGLPVRRGRAAERERHARPSADADDRRQPRPRAAAAGEAQGRPGRLRRRCARARPPSSSASRALRRRGLRLRRRRCRCRTMTSCNSARRAPTCRWSRRARALRSGCRRTSGARACSPRTSERTRCPAVDGPAGGDCGQLLDRDAGAGGRHARASSRVPGAFRPTSPRARMSSALRLNGLRSRVTKEPVLIYATATPEEVKAAQAELGVGRAGSAGRERAGRRSRRAWSGSGSDR